MKPKYKLHYFFDYGPGYCLWSANDAARNRFGYPVDHHLLPLSPDTTTCIDQMATWFQTSLNWGDPGSPLLWQQDECDRFNRAALALFTAIEVELGNEFEVRNEHRDLSTQD